MSSSSIATAEIAAPTTAAKVVNFVSFQAVWFAIVLSAADGRAWIGLTALGVHVVAHLAMTTTPRAVEVTMLLVATAAGLLVDHLPVYFGVQVFAEGFATVGLVPIWIGGLWLGFATTLHSSLGWMRGRYLLGFVFGGVFGPLAYVGAEELGGLAIGDLPRWVSLVAIGLEWGIMMPLMLWIAARVDGRRV